MFTTSAEAAEATQQVSKNGATSKPSGFPDTEDSTGAALDTERAHAVGSTSGTVVDFHNGSKTMRQVARSVVLMRLVRSSGVILTLGQVHSFGKESCIPAQFCAHPCCETQVVGGRFGC